MKAKSPAELEPMAAGPGRAWSLRPPQILGIVVQMMASVAAGPLGRDAEASTSTRFAPSNDPAYHRPMWMPRSAMPPVRCIKALFK